MTKGLLYFRDNPNHLPTLLFLLRLGVFFETNFSEIYGPEKSQQMLKSYQERLEKLLAIPDLEESQKYELNLHWVLVNTQRTQRSDSEEIALLLSIFKFRKEYHSISYTWLTVRLRGLIRAHAFQLKDRLADPSFCNLVCTTLIKELCPEALPFMGKDWSGGFSVYRSGALMIDFLHGKAGHTKRVL